MNTVKIRGVPLHQVVTCKHQVPSKLILQNIHRCHVTQQTRRLIVCMYYGVLSLVTSHTYKLLAIKRCFNLVRLHKESTWELYDNFFHINSPRLNLTVHIITNQKVSFRYWKSEFLVCRHGTCTINERQTLLTMRGKPKLNMHGKPN
jgi:hypothetical protein